MSNVITEQFTISSGVTNTTLKVTNGIDNNIITPIGYTTKNTNANATHYLTFVDSSTTGVGAIQKTNGLSCNPNTNTITATNFNGLASNATNAVNSTDATNATNLVLTSDNSSGSFFIPFSKLSAGTHPLYLDDTTSSLTYNPSSSTITCSNFSGLASDATNAVNSTNLVLTSDNTAGTYYIPFSKLSAGTNPLFLDDTTGPLSYNPSTSTLTATNFSGTATNTNNVLTTSDAGLAAVTYIPFVKTSGTGQKAYFIDDTTLPLTYVPSTSVLTCGGVIGTIQLPGTINAATYSLGTTLTVNMGSFRTFNNFNIGFTGTTNTVSIFSFSGAIGNGMYYVAIYNGGSGDLTINATGFGAGYRTTYTAPIIVPTTTRALMAINYIAFTTGGATYVVSVDLVD